jgi:hypothetical protein
MSLSRLAGGERRTSRLLDSPMCSLGDAPSLRSHYPRDETPQGLGTHRVESSRSVTTHERWETGVARGTGKFEARYRRHAQTPLPGALAAAQGALGESSRELGTIRDSRSEAMIREGGSQESGMRVSRPDDAHMVPAGIPKRLGDYRRLTPSASHLVGVYGCNVRSSRFTVHPRNE